MGNTVTVPLGQQSVVCLVEEAEILWWNGCVNSDNVVRSDYQSVSVHEELNDIQDDPDFLPSRGTAPLFGLTW